MTLLLVDDDKKGQDTLVKYLNQISEGELTIYTAQTLAQGLAIDHEKKPHVVLLDLLLPDSPNWRDTVTKICDFKAPVVVVTGLDIAANDYEIFLACLKNGAKRVFEKPQMGVLWKWLGEKPHISWAARLLGTAGSAYLDSKAYA